MEKCRHKKTHFERWPDGDDIEVCDDCGKSRHISELQTSDWLMVDIKKAREEMTKNINKIIKKVVKRRNK